MRTCRSWGSAALKRFFHFCTHLRLRPKATAYWRTDHVGCSSTKVRNRDRSCTHSSSIAPLPDVFVHQFTLEGDDVGDSRVATMTPINTETIEVAQAVFPKGNIYMRMRDE